MIRLVLTFVGSWVRCTASAVATPVRIGTDRFFNAVAAAGARMISRATLAIF